MMQTKFVLHLRPSEKLIRFTVCVSFCRVYYIYDFRKYVHICVSFFFFSFLSSDYLLVGVLFVCYCDVCVYFPGRVNFLIVLGPS